METETLVDRSTSLLVCAACGETRGAQDTRPFRCSHVGEDDGDHILQQRVVSDVTLEKDQRAAFSSDEPDPFVRYRKLTHAWRSAIECGVSDDEYIRVVQSLETAVARVDGRSFAVTTFESHPALARAIGLEGELWVKNETDNVSGSHKGRHLMGLMIWLELAKRRDPSLGTSPLAIASCGNAALAAAVLARATGRRLNVFIPVDASEAVVAHLERLGAHLTRCPRIDGERGDPCYLRFREAIAHGALPFTCQGNENGLVIEGGKALGWEIASELAARGARLDRLFIQTGGGALASACIAGLEDAVRLGVIASLPRIHAVQTASASPLKRAWDRVLSRIGARDGVRLLPSDAEETLQYLVRHRSEFMTAWETTPSSVAHGILDDETYDWVAVVRGMLDSGGWPLVVDEDELREANRVAVETTTIDVDPTGSAGLAGVLHMKNDFARGESISVLFTGRSHR